MAQTFAGDKTFSGNIIANLAVTATGAVTGSNLSGTNSGDMTMGAPSGSSANGATITGQVLSLCIAGSGTPGIVSTGTQTFNGNKTIAGVLSGNMLRAANAWADTNVAAFGSSAYLGWNRTGGSAETDFVNNRGATANPGGFMWYDTPDGVTYAQCASLSKAGDFTAQASLNSTTNLQVGTYGNVNTYLKCNGNTGIGTAGQGLYLGWNYQGGGSGDILNHHGAGATGGVNFTDTDGTTFTKYASIDMKGQHWGSNYGANLKNLGTVGAAITVDWTVSMNETITLTSATNCTLTFTAPLNPCFLFLKVVAPASGTTPTMTFPATCKGSPPTTVTLAKTSVYPFWWDGTNYYYLPGCLNA